jgi:formate hydrogenlyase transcriptional activator
MGNAPEASELLLERLKLVGEVTDKINRGRGLDEVFQSLYEELGRLIPCNRLSIGFLQPDGHTLVLGPVQTDEKIFLATGYHESIDGSSLKPLIEKGETRIINDLEEYLERKPKSRSTRLIVREGMKSSLTVPLIVADRRVGVMWFSSRSRSAYVAEHEAFMRIIAGHVAILIEKGQLVSRLEADNKELAEANKLKASFVERLKEEVDRQTLALQRSEQKQKILLGIAKAIHSTLDLAEVFRTLVQTLRPVLQFDRTSILMLSDHDRILRFRELEPPDREFLGRDSLIPVEGSAAGQAIRDGRPLYTPDLEAGTPLYEDGFLLRAGIRSRVVIPLFVQRRPIGTFNLASNKRNPFSEDDLDFLSQLAEQVSVAVANSEAYRQVEQLKNRLQDENVQLREVMTRSPQLSELVGESGAWKKVLRQVEMVAATDASVLIRGETGTGKELIARAIHRLSPRSEKPFVAINCAALSPDLVASELFGHEKGAFTGAAQLKLGRLELADQGTLFLDEVAELPGEMQVKLLRVLQEREFERVGGTKTLKVNVRLIAATNRDLERARAEGTFRDDLYFRLNVFPIHVPPLRERKEDIEPLILYFLHRYAHKVNKTFDRVDRRAIERCLQYHWPGNVRELENLVERSVIVSPGPVLLMDPLLEADALSRDLAPLPTLKDTVKAQLVQALRLTRGKIYGKDGAAALLGLKPSTLQMRLRKLGLNRKVIGGLEHPGPGRAP